VELDFMRTPARLAWLAALAAALPLHAAAPPAREGAAIAPAPIPASAWKGASRKPATAAEIDALINAGLARAGVRPAGVVGDAQFLRRVYLDLWGRPPRPDELQAFLADGSPGKRARVIDRLLDGPAFARHWAEYWRDVMSARVVGGTGRILARPFQTWMAEQIRKNRPWSDITRDLLTASGVARFDNRDGKSGPAFFLASHMGADAVAEQTAETSRVFLGIQINCAQCHDHPFDSWKREQFHELAAYFARVRTRLVRDPDSERIRFLGLELVSLDRGFGGGRMMRPGMGRFGGAFEHRMPAKEGGTRGGTVVHPRSLNGQAPARGLPDGDRRKALADAVTSKDNHWFAAAFANRVWGVLLGQPFYAQVDDLGPMREAVHGPVLARLTGSFAGTGHDVKALFRTILNTEAYQRHSRVGSSRGEHNLFANSYPARLRPGQIHESLVVALGPLGGGFGGFGGRGMMGRGGFGGFGVEGMIRSEFGFDPSLKNDDVEGSIPQALILMNSTQVHQRVRAAPANFLGKVLAEHTGDEPAVEAVYLQVLGRKPAARERAKSLAYVARVGKRAEAFEDILWALLNSAEFQTRR
jgi:hypothetical protein